MSDLKDVEKEFGAPAPNPKGYFGAIFLTLCWIVTAFAGIIAGWIFIYGIGRADSAPREAALAATALAIAAIPYVVTRAFEGIRRNKVD
ncbi:hypothetical protein ACSHT0_04015 [Tepidicaulis sp. LMO-SS28]|uniref:hypothetical protein n=1 Tax=Tepidicaulis sp. LMO-SS28 TaxID=3447455 RepID=UPI003EDF9D9B